MKSEIFATVWQDHALGPLHLKHPRPDKAVEMAQRIAVKGTGKISHVRAVRLTPDDELIDLIPPLNSGE